VVGRRRNAVVFGRWEHAEATACDLLRKLGYKDAAVTKLTGDGGVDVISKKWRMVAQVKQHGTSVGLTHISKLAADAPKFDARVCVFISTSGYAKGVTERADAMGVACFVMPDSATLYPMNHTARKVARGPKRRHAAPDWRVATPLAASGTPAPAPPRPSARDRSTQQLRADQPPSSLPAAWTSPPPVTSPTPPRMPHEAAWAATRRAARSAAERIPPIVAKARERVIAGYGAAPHAAVVPAGKYTMTDGTVRYHDGLRWTGWVLRDGAVHREGPDGFPGP
jgi:hypothetical protein